MNSSLTQSMHPKTLLALETFVTQWNQDPATSNHTLIITGNQISLVNGNSLLDPLIERALGTENEETIENSLTKEPSSLQNLLDAIDFNGINYPDEPANEVTDPLEIQEENIVPINIFEEELEQDIPSLVTLSSLKESDLTKLKEDFNANSSESPIRASPLSTSLFNEQLNEIISRIQKGTGGRNREKQIRTLEACYHLETLKIAHQDNFTKLQEVNRVLQEKLRQRKASLITTSSRRIFQLLTVCGKDKLYSTKYVTVSNLFRLTEDSFSALLEALRTHGVRF